MISDAIYDPEDAAYPDYAAQEGLLEGSETYFENPSAQQGATDFLYNSGVGTADYVQNSGVGTADYVENTGVGTADYVQNFGVGTADYVQNTKVDEYINVDPVDSVEAFLYDYNSAPERIEPSKPKGINHIS